MSQCFAEFVDFEMVNFGEIQENYGEKLCFSVGSWDHFIWLVVYLPL